MLDEVRSKVHTIDGQHGLHKAKSSWVHLTSDHDGFQLHDVPLELSPLRLFFSTDRNTILSGESPSILRNDFSGDALVRSWAVPLHHSYKHQTDCDFTILISLGSHAHISAVHHEVLPLCYLIREDLSKFGYPILCNIPPNFLLRIFIPSSSVNMIVRRRLPLAIMPFISKLNMCHTTTRTSLPRWTQASAICLFLYTSH
jgi:hypothetical protein